MATLINVVVARALAGYLIALALASTATATGGEGETIGKVNGTSTTSGPGLEVTALASGAGPTGAVTDQGKIIGLSLAIGSVIVGEVCNFVAYAFVQPILVAPLGALSVVICAILSSIFLRERLSMTGKVGCALCIVGATVIVLHAPEQTSVKTIQEFQHYMFQPIFLTWMLLIIFGSLILIFKVGPRWGKENMMIYIGVCSLIGSLSVVATQGLGAAIVHNIATGENQFNNWFIYFVIVFMVITLLTEINYLNKALNLFNTAMVTPTYYVTFTSATIITSAILYQGFAASVIAIITVCLGFLVICGGVLLLQTSKPVVPLHIPGGASIDGVLSNCSGTLTYDDIEPNAADMRASPFSSIRRITRDLRQQPSFVTATGTHVPFHSSPLNPNSHHPSQAQLPGPSRAAADNLLNRKRRASNAALRSRPGSVIFGPGGGTAAASSSISAFHPSASGPYSTIVMGPHGSQIRLQLCEIVVSDEKNETTNRYQVYRPMPNNDNGAAHGQQHPPHFDNPRRSIVATSTAYSGKLPFLAPRTSLMTDSRSSSIRFSDNQQYHPHHAPSSRVSLEENENENEKETTQQQQQNHSSAISGSLFVPPALSISPPTLNNNTATPNHASPVTPSTSSPLTRGPGLGPGEGPLVPGGSFFTRPPKLRSPSSCTAASSGGDIMEINEPGHGRSVVVSVEPVQQQPLYSIYVPPPPPLHGHTQNIKNNKQHPTSSTPTGSSAVVVVHAKEANDADQGPTSTSETSPSVASSSTPSSPLKPKRRFFGNLFGVGTKNGKNKEASSISHDDNDTNKNTLASTPPTTDKPLDKMTHPHNGIMEKDDHADASVTTAGQEEEEEEGRGDQPSSPSSSTDLIPPSSQSSDPASSSDVFPPAAIVFNRTNHPTRISEGEEEEDDDEKDTNLAKI
ncbi:hypothetical protein BGZ94_002663 [Podila epigama]|nr:hypothetical protein BGZ94_002663 [Podila epigama]